MKLFVETGGRAQKDIIRAYLGFAGTHKPFFIILIGHHRLIPITEHKKRLVGIILCDDIDVAHLADPFPTPGKPYRQSSGLVKLLKPLRADLLKVPTHITFKRRTNILLVEQTRG